MPPGALVSPDVTDSKNCNPDVNRGNNALSVTVRSAHKTNVLPCVPTERHKFAVDARVGPDATATDSRHPATRACSRSTAVYWVPAVP